MQTFEEFYKAFDKQYVVEEGVLRNIATGALLGASLLGGVNQSDAASKTYNKPAIVQTTKSIKLSPAMSKFAEIWAKHYNAEKSDKTKWAKQELSTRTSLPNARLIKAMDKAAKCFAGDAGLSYNDIIKLLKYTGRLESNYMSTNLQSKSGAFGYWQVLASTAQDRLTDGAAYFGKNFEKQFGKGSLKKFQKLTFKQLQYKLKTDPDFCAAMSAVKWVTIAQQLKNKQTHVLTNMCKTLK